MPTLVTHPLVALSFFKRVPHRVLIAGIVGTMIPDADVAAFAFGIPYEHTFGHRGFSHSIVFALLFASLATLIVRGRFAAFAYIFICTMSHGVLDALTDGGLGIAFFSPFSNERYFFPWTPIRVSPIGPRFFSARGLETLVSEVVWVWVPCAVIALLGKYVFHVERKSGQQR